MRKLRSAHMLAALAGLLGNQFTGSDPTTPGGSRRAMQPTKRYPEQSSRQAMRGHRRAQGGPGVELNRRTHEYQPRYF